MCILSYLNKYVLIVFYLVQTDATHFPKNWQVEFGCYYHSNGLEDEAVYDYCAKSINLPRQS